jgi:hypothetical protein
MARAFSEPVDGAALLFRAPDRGVVARFVEVGPIRQKRSRHKLAHTAVESSGGRLMPRRLADGGERRIPRTARVIAQVREFNRFKIERIAVPGQTSWVASFLLLGSMRRHRLRRSRVASAPPSLTSRPALRNADRACRLSGREGIAH